MTILLRMRTSPETKPCGVLRLKPVLRAARLIAAGLSLTMLLSISDAMEMNPPRGLMVDLLTQPELSVITNDSPRFSWIVDDPRSGAVQTAWQILVASSEAKLVEGADDVWDSGKIESSQSIGIVHSNSSLQPNSAYWWTVRVWDADDKPGPWSARQRFFTGDFDGGKRKWPGESRWVPRHGGGSDEQVLENRHTPEYREIAPASVVRNRDGNYFVTFERAKFGTLKLRVKANEISGPLFVHLGEKAADDGDRVDRSPGGSITYKRAELLLDPDRSEHMLELPRQVSSYPNSQVLADHKPEVTAFRFAEIENHPGELGVEDVRQLALLYPFDDDAAFFTSSSGNLNEVWELSKHTLKATPFLALYVDGARERMPYEADAYIQQISHYCVDREYAIGRHTMEFLIFNPSWPTEWHLHIVPMAWADFVQTGDDRSLARYYDELKAKTLLALAREDGLISTRTGLVTDEFLASIHYEGRHFRDIVDWPQGTPANEETHRSGHGSERIEGETDRFVFSEINTVVNAFHYWNLDLMSKIARVLDKEEDGKWFADRAEKVKRAFNAALLDPETGLYTDGEGVDHSSLHANMFPVAFGLAPPKHHAGLLEFIQSRGMACSPYGAPYLMDALFALGGAEHALALLTSEDSRSWMNMIRIGSTMTTEAWDMRYKRNLTWNHAWGASPAHTITRRIMGIVPVEPAFQKIRIQPRPGGLKEASIRTPTIRGPVEVRFENTPNELFRLEVVLPANTSGEILLPRPPAGDFTLTHNGRAVEARVSGDALVINPVKSGRHEFLLTHSP